MCVRCWANDGCSAVGCGCDVRRERRASVTGGEVEDRGGRAGVMEESYFFGCVSLVRGGRREDLDLIIMVSEAGI